MPPQASIRGYELFERIGAGAESVIYRARQLSTGRIVAVKHVAVDTRDGYKYLRHARNEYKVLRRLTNGDAPPGGVIRVYDLLTSGLLRRRKEHVLVMDYIEGLDLRRERRYPMGQMVDILTQVATSLAAIHVRGFIHGDLKPENIVVTPAGKPTLVDFGFSCRVGAKATSIRGTRDYMAPEQIDMDHLTVRTDLYNFGATMYYLFGGRHVPALIAPEDAQHFITSRQVQTPPLRALNPSIPPTLDNVILKCVEKEIVARPSCIEEVREVLLDVGRRYFDLN